MAAVSPLDRWLTLRSGDYRRLVKGRALDHTPRQVLRRNALLHEGNQRLRDQADQLRARLALVGRSLPPPREEWDGWLAAHGPDDPASRKILGLRKLDELGSARQPLLDHELAEDLELGVEGPEPLHDLRLAPAPPTSAPPAPKRTDLSFLASATSTLRLATGILVLPQRNPVVLAKELATLDRLSGGRLVLGIGVGWLREEMEILQAPFHNRGRRADDAGEQATLEFERDLHDGLQPVLVAAAMTIASRSRSPPRLRLAGLKRTSWVVIRIPRSVLSPSCSSVS